MRRRRIEFRSVALTLMFGTLGASASETPHFNYLLHCAGCHQVDGSGLSDGSVPTFKGSLGHFVRSAKGRAFLVQVPGSAQSPLSDQELADVLNWLLIDLYAAELPEKFERYTAAEVHKLRDRPIDDAQLQRERIVGELRASGYDVR